MNDTSQHPFDPDPTSAGFPLRGLSIIFTRPADSDPGLAAALTAAGADLLQAPVLEFASLIEDNIQHCARVLRELSGSRGWLILPSPAAIRYFHETLNRIGLTAQDIAGVRVATVGQASAAALSAIGLHPSFIPPAATGESLAQTLPAEPGVPVLIAGSVQTRPELRNGLTARGLTVQVLPLYAPRPSRDGMRLIQQALAENPTRLLIVTSPSAVDALMDAIGPDSPILSTLKWIGLGPTTGRRMLEKGIPATRMAEAVTPTVAGLMAAILRTAG